MASAKSTDPSTVIRTSFARIERAVLAHYLGIPDPAPQDLAGIDISAPVDPDEWDEARHGIAPLPSEMDDESLMIENVVALICLQLSEAGLPQWAVVSAAGVTLARRPAPAAGAPPACARATCSRSIGKLLASRAARYSA